MDDQEEQVRLKRSIDSSQQELDRNLAALEAKAEDMLDWRTQFDRHPAVFLGLAAGGGLLAAALLGGSSRKRGRAEPVAPQEPDSAAARRSHPHQGNSTWEGIREAAGVIATSVALDMLHQVVPGFKDKFEEIKAKVESNRHRAMSSS
jgi:hypothetical protein